MHEPASLGEILKSYIEDNGLNVPTVAAAMRVHPNDVNELIAGVRTIDANWASRLAHAFSTTPHYWLNLHNNHQCWMAENKFMKLNSGVQTVINHDTDNHD